MWLFLFLVISGLVNAAVITEIDGTDFANNKLSEVCGTYEANLCVGNTVRVVEDGIVTFYVPDGKVIDCPDATNKDEEIYCYCKEATGNIVQCLQRLRTEFCSSENACNSLSTDIRVDTEPLESNSEDVPAENMDKLQDDSFEESDPTPPPSPVVTEGNVDEQITPLKPNPDENLVDLLPIIFILGVVTLIVLFVLFKRSMH